DLAYASGKHASYRLLPTLAEAGILLNAVPGDLKDIEELFHSRCMDPVVAFRVVTPQHGYFRRHVTVKWQRGSTPIETLEQPAKIYSDTKSQEQTDLSVDVVGDEVVAGKRRVEVVLAADQLL